MCVSLRGKRLIMLIISLRYGNYVSANERDIIVTDN
jgi:hypothetical protein